jgi:hypothetical protein
MTDSDEGRGRSRKLGAHVGYSLAERSRGWVTMCVVYIVREEMSSVGFFV